MIRRGQQKKRDERRARKAVAAALGAEKGNYVPPNREDCVGRSYYTPANETGSARIVSRLWRASGQLADFHLTVQVLSWETSEWFDVLRVDICHGHAHAHRIKDGQDVAEEPQHVFRVDTVEDVELAYSQSVEHCVTVGASLAEKEG